MLGENILQTISGTTIGEGSHQLSLSLLCGVSGTSIIPLNCDGQGKLLIVNAGSIGG